MGLPSTVTISAPSTLHCTTTISPATIWSLSARKSTLISGVGVYVAVGVNVGLGVLVGVGVAVSGARPIRGPKKEEANMNGASAQPAILSTIKIPSTTAATAPVRFCLTISKFMVSFRWHCFLTRQSGRFFKLPPLE